MSSDGDHKEHLLAAGDGWRLTLDVDQDGKMLIYRENFNAGQDDVIQLPHDGAVRLLRTLNELLPVVDRLAALENPESE